MKRTPFILVALFAITASGCGHCTGDDLRGLPGVLRVEVSPANGNPTTRIIHVLDYHHVPQNNLPPGTDYAAFLRRVAHVQAQQLVFLRALKPAIVFVEGVTQDSLAEFRELRQIALEHADDVDSETALALGVTVRLPGVEVLPLDDVATLDAAHPHKGNADAIERRREGIVRNVVARGGGVIVLGASHDLTAVVRRLAHDCEYVRVWVKGVDEPEKRPGVTP